MIRLFAARALRPFRPLRLLRLIGTLVVVAFFSGMVHAGMAYAGVVHADVWGRCERVVDGDTVWVSGVGKVRLIGVDTPELGSGWTAGGDEPGARRAKEFVAKLIEGKRVRLEFDEERFDRYGRTLAYLYTEAGESLGELLLAQGLAEPIFYFSYRMKARYFSLWRAQRAE
jgi:micrococcal nuclease